VTGEQWLSNGLEFTGERFTPECVREIRYEHLHRYAFARGWVRGRTVLDAACGEGYGAALLAGTAAAVTGVDVSGDAIEHARRRYGAANLEFQVADCLDLPFAAGAFDCIVSFETLEHLADQDGLLREFRRVLKPEGFLLLSSPDRAVYSGELQNRNEYHVRELDRDELEQLLQAHFPAYRLWGQRLLFHSAIWSLDGAEAVIFQQEGDSGVAVGSSPGHEPVYFIAVCAAEQQYLPAAAPGLSLFDDAEESVYRHYHHEIRKNMAAGTLLQERDHEVAELRARLAAASAVDSGQGGSTDAAAGDPAKRSWWRRLLGGS
jgi:ubiquinone/menaquinone biosynthesis C-methylase UbiE